MTLEAIKYKRGQLEILDQLLLPNQSVYLPVRNTGDAWWVIKKMQVRGAPAIGVVGALSLVCELYTMDFGLGVEQLCDYVMEKLDYLVTARPTAVNMKDVRDKMAAALNQLKGSELSHLNVADAKEKVITALERLQLEDITANKSMGLYGAQHIMRISNAPVQVLTHCNTGSLATSGYGTALGVVRSLHQMGQLAHCFCTETRPYNQGSRLTAYELTVDRIPSTLICDNMVGALMSQRPIHAVLVGADRVVANGDTANKIGTYQIAVLAKHHNVPFYVVAPHTSIDLTLKDGSDIEIEERPQREMIYIQDVCLAPESMNCWNPAFDVTPADLITGGIVTEFGVFQPSELEDGLKTWLAAEPSFNLLN